MKTDKFIAVDVVVLEVGNEVPVFHPRGHDAEARVTSHLDPCDCQNIGIRDLFGHEHLLAEVLRVT